MIIRVMLFICCWCSLQMPAQGQENLVNNPDFEEWLPGQGFRISKSVPGWSEIAAGEIGYINTHLPNCKPMQNPYGKQAPHSGNGYVFLKAASQSRSGEGDMNRYYLQTRLKRPLKAGERFTISFWFSLADNSTLAIEEFSAHLYKEQFQKMGDLPKRLYKKEDSATGGDLSLTNMRALHKIANPHGIVEDTEQWLQVSADLVAVGGEEWLVIGCFAPSYKSFGKRLPKRNFNWWDSYIFVDDVYLYVQPVPQPKTDTLLTAIHITKQLEETGEVAISDVLFAHNSPQLTEAALPTLDTIVKVLQTFRHWNISIEGHTDNEGDSTYNARLSLRRAQEVAVHLNQKGISQSRMQVRGWGASKPLLPNTNSRNRRRNRRVVIHLRRR